MAGVAKPSEPVTTALTFCVTVSKIAKSMRSPDSRWGQLMRIFLLSEIHAGLTTAGRPPSGIVRIQRIVLVRASIRTISPRLLYNSTLLPSGDQAIELGVPLEGNVATVLDA